MKKPFFHYEKKEGDQLIRNELIVRQVEEALKYNSEHGRSTAVIRCPFCQRKITVYIWSLAGSGKRCDCGALLCNRNAMIETSKIINYENKN